jgi:hypothetical protein
MIRMARLVDKKAGHCPLPYSMITVAGIPIFYTSNKWYRDRSSGPHLFRDAFLSIQLAKEFIVI